MWLKILCTGILATAGIATSVHAASSVGRVTLAIGAGTLSSVGGGPEPIVAGAEIRPGDSVTTGAGGHVHIRFVDGGLVSVRPHSNLTIEDYDYRADLPALSKVRFQLKEGTARSISGAAAEAAKQRFRLNTPLVAIGVRGTDFVVQSTGAQSTATVNQGAIVVAPFGDGCSLQGVGPCGGASAVLVTPEMTGLLAEYRAGQAQAQLRQLTSAESARPGTSLASAQGVGSTERSSSSSGLLGGNALASSAPTNPAAIDTAALLAGLPSVNLPVIPPALAWGRWGEAAFAQDFSTAYLSAREGREVTVANNTHVLYRATDLAPQTASGAVDFTLTQSYAQYKSASHQLSAATVSGAQLNINFGLKNFSTTLQIHSSATGLHTLQGSGAIDASGLFHATTATQNIAGTTAAAGTSAGYLFNKEVGGGNLSGITLWAK